MKPLLLLGIVFLCTNVFGQEVRPIESADYLALINKNKSGSNNTIDSSNNMQTASLRNSRNNLYLLQQPIGKITIDKDSSVVIHPKVDHTLFIGGSFNLIAETQQANHLPALQKEFVQGRSLNGKMEWQGAETGELFSYGPSIANLEYDGSSYEYDLNGKLVQLGTGNGVKAGNYNNSVLRSGSLFSKEINLSLKYPTIYQPKIFATFKAGESREQTIITNTGNNGHHFNLTLESTLKYLTIRGNYSFEQLKYSHNNIDGFLNRVYKSCLLTPISFSTRQAYTIGNFQRTYSPETDNPFYLLDDKGHTSRQEHHSGSLSIEQRTRQMKIKIVQSLEALSDGTLSSYKPGTAFLPNGSRLDRLTNNHNYLLDLNVVVDFKQSNYKLRSQVTSNYVYSNNHSKIEYSGGQIYSYQRSANDFAVNYSTEYRGYNFETGGVISNKAYISNTQQTKHLFLPAVSAYLRLYSLFGIEKLYTKLFASYNSFNSELPISQSLAACNLLKYQTADAIRFQSNLEVQNFDVPEPIQHREYNVGVEVNYKYKITLSATWFNRHTINDIFPLITSGKIELKNMATHRNRGIEMDLSFNPTIWGTKKVSFSNSISFISYRSNVLEVKSDFNYTPLAGFADVHKTLIEGEPLGVIYGNKWLRDANGKMIIGSDGFPIANPRLGVVGDPTPDFVMKFNHRVVFKERWDLSINWEWKKGGDVWNGTQALLDYYGRSQTTGQQRSITNYVFDGVTVAGTYNTNSVNFYDPSRPIEQNRWVRYGHSGVAEDYIQKGDCIRIRTIGLSYRSLLKKRQRQFVFTLYANNIMIWSPYDGVDPDQLLYDQAGTTGLDFFNLPAARSAGISVTFQF